MRATVATTGLGVALMALLSMADTASAQNCLDRTVTIADLAAELNRCNPAKLPALCNVNPPQNPQFIHKQVAAYDGADIRRWLARGPAATLYTARQQEELVAKTEALANANRPRRGDKVFDIQFFRKAYGAPGEYQIGANITYTRCPPSVPARVVTGPTGPTWPPDPTDPRDNGPYPCPRSGVFSANLAAELNRVSHCTSGFPRLPCNGQPAATLIKQISGLNGAEIPGWLAESDASQLYVRAEQDSIIKATYEIANANTPPQSSPYFPKFFVYDIQFIREEKPGRPETRYFTGANVTYAYCPVEYGRDPWWRDLDLQVYHP
ncbi:MAG: hypothetical protein QOF14_4092 [Hyphomicrobiales bacterium]|jgi:hypothetical protein|nr:hypothetical protein [Hyphomicrobiales bacterium]